jgi:lipopolysaccharide transport system ATP-binding protein
MAFAAGSEYAVEFRDVSRRFVLHHERRSSFQDWFIGLIKPSGSAEEFWALRDVSFGIRRGETIGIVGRNGAGKSTLLKLVTRILEPSSGKVIVNGRTYAMLELGAGFHPDLSGRDNIYLNGSLYGFNRKEMARRYEEIVRFAELERFVDTPVKHYSSGMYARLGFGIAVHMDPEILVIDEVLAVGDANFQQKCFQQLEVLKARGTTIIFVSHDADSVRSFCDRAALIVGGHLLDIGPADEVIDHYERLLHEMEPVVSLLRERAVDRIGIATDELLAGDDLRIEALLRTPGSVSTAGLALNLDLYDERGTHLFGTQAMLPEQLPAAVAGSQRADDEPDTRVAAATFRRPPLASGSLRLVATLLDGQAAGREVIDRRETVVRVDEHGGGASGLLALEHDWAWNGPATSDVADAPAGMTIFRR